MTEHIRALKAEHNDALRAAQHASLPSVRAYFQDEARRLALLIAKAETRSALRTLASLHAGVCR